LVNFLQPTVDPLHHPFVLALLGDNDFRVQLISAANEVVCRRNQVAYLLTRRLRFGREFLLKIIFNNC
jgi:hypothetical protein